MKEKFLKQFDFASKIEERLRNKKSAEEAKTEIIDFEALLEEFKTKQETSFPIGETLGFRTIELDTLDRAEEVAAVSGQFNPNELLNSFVVDEKTKEFVLTYLAPDCTIDTLGIIKWALHNNKRKEVLFRMVKDQSFKKVIDQPLPQTDLYGEVLRTVIKKGKEINLGELDQARILALINILETTSGVDFPKPELAEVRQHLPPAELLSNYETLAAEFIGRDNELKVFGDFLSKSNDKSTYEWEGLVLTGLGGVGKSTLLAKFTSEVLKNKLATVAILDFDRPGIDARDPFWLELEISRQVGIQYPEWNGRLSQSREHLRSVKDEGRYDQSIGSQQMESMRSISKTLMSDVLSCLHESGNDQKPFLLVFDTIEEVTQRYLLGELLEWISYFPYQLHPIPVKVIFSGRLYEKQLDDFKNLHQIESNPIEIKGFDFSIAQKFLEKKKINSIDASKLVYSGIVPLHPLELKLVANLVMEGTTTVDALIADLKEGKKKQPVSELFSGIVYRRVLMRINHPELDSTLNSVLREMAYPGLVLRYLTAPIIDEILKPAINLNISAEGQSHKLIDELERYSWLGYKNAEGELWHSKELRRTMLRLMITEEHDKVLAIRKRAIEYFEGLKTEKGIAEAMYHRLMMVSEPKDGEDINLDSIRGASASLNETLVDLSMPARALLSYAASGQVSDHDLELLPDKLFRKAYYDLGGRFVSDRKFSQAFKFYQRAFNIKPQNNQTVEVLPNSYERELLFYVGEWSLLRPKLGSKIVDGKTATIKDYIFPAALIAPEKIDRDFLAEILASIAKDKNQLSEIFSSYESVSFITNLSYGLILLNEEQPLSESILKHLREVLDFVSKGRRIPNMEKSIFNLYFLCYGKPESSYQINPSIIRLDREWIRLLKSYCDHPGIDELDKFMQRKPLWGKDLLSLVDQLKTRYDWKSVVLNLESIDPEIQLQLIRGTDPIFRDPCRYTILELYPTRPKLVELGQLIQSCLKPEYEDLKPSHFADILSGSTESTMHTYIELVDRSWALGDLLQMLKERNPESKKVIDIAEAYQRWENSSRG